MTSMRWRVRCTLAFLILAAAAGPLAAQQTGSIRGKVATTDGATLPGVIVSARSDVLPQPREAVTGANGEYLLPALPPGAYTLEFAMSGMQTVTRKAVVQLAQATPLDVTLGIGLSEEITVTAESSIIDKDSATLASGLSNEQILGLPMAQEYRDLQKLIPGVQYTQDQTRGPSAGGSGQDNVYNFDGVNVTLPLFGTLSAEPASHDIAQVTVIKGGARAVDFDRAGGFSIDSVSKSGTSEFHGTLSYRLQSAGMSSELASGIQSRYEQDRDWLNANLGGPVLKDRLFFYGSYYRPTSERENAANLYGELPSFESTRNEYFGKLTFTPTPQVLLNASYRDSKRVEKSDQFLANAAPTTGTGSEARLKIFTADGSWVINTQELPHLQVHALREPDRGHAGQRRRRGAVDGGRDRARRREPRLAGPAHRARAGRRRSCLQRLRPAADRPLRLHAERREGRRRDRGLRPGVQRPGLLPRLLPGGLQPDAGLERAARSARRLPVVPRGRGSRPQLERLGPPLRARWAARGHPGNRTGRLVHGAHPAAVRGAARHALGVPVAQFRAQRHDQVAGLDLQRGRAAEQGHALRAGAARRLVHPLGLRRRPRQQVLDVRASAQQDDPAAARRHLGLQRQGHALRELRAVQAGRELAAARGLLGPQPHRHLHRLPLRRQRGAVRGRSRGLVLGQALRRGPRPADYERVPARYGPHALAEVVGAALRPLPRVEALLGGHEQQRARGLPAASRHPARARTSRTSPPSSPRSAAARPT